MLKEHHFSELKEKGFTVVENVISPEHCDEAIREYKTWLSNFGDGFPNTFNSLLKGHNSGHMSTTWRIRLKTKPVFAQLWNTEKLLTSFDAIAIGQPPEDDTEEFQDPNKYWLHADCTPSRVGLHAYQGSVYLEEQREDDWTFQVIEGSHRYLEQLFDEHPRATEEARKKGYIFFLGEEDQSFFLSKGCKLARVPVPKGGMILWDNRLVHANARPIKVLHLPEYVRVCS